MFLGKRHLMFKGDRLKGSGSGGGNFHCELVPLAATVQLITEP